MIMMLPLELTFILSLLVALLGDDPLVCAVLVPLGVHLQHVRPVFQLEDDVTLGPVPTVVATF